MKILGNRILVSKVEEPKTEGFQATQITDSFVNKGKVEGFGDSASFKQPVEMGDTVLFAKYSPDTQEIEHEGKKMKIISVSDVLAIL